MKSFTIYPRAYREDKEVAEKFRLRTEKAIEKQRVEREILATKRTRHMTDHKSASYTGAMNMYIIDAEEEKMLKETSLHSTAKSDSKYLTMGSRENLIVTMIRFFKSVS